MRDVPSPSAFVHRLSTVWTCANGIDHVSTSGINVLRSTLRRSYVTSVPARQGPNHENQGLPGKGALFIFSLALCSE